ncbi:MAG: hypothetical protein HY608_03500 [Planctomycetes bacterium]|nr:hypothetical protein [Planctomycetota bacterium]
MKSADIECGRFLSVRVTRDVRAVGIRQDDVMVWFWIGSHGEYEQVIAKV